jgi:hypothetical protein
VFPLAEEIYLTPYTAVLKALHAVANINAIYWVAYTSLLINAINDVYSNETTTNGGGYTL